jgi:hypothetical protein
MTPEIWKSRGNISISALPTKCISRHDWISKLNLKFWVELFTVETLRFSWVVSI